MTLPDYAIKAQGLVKTYAATKTTPEKTALRGIDLAIPRGAMFGLLGPNGAGKSTFINILAGLCAKTEGEVSIWGVNIDQHPRAARAGIGVVPQELAADVFFTPRESLEVQAGLYGVPKRERHTMEILNALGLGDKADAYVRQLSGGMKRRLMVAKAMVHQPPVLILDEPTAGVDVELRRQLWAYVQELNHRGVTIVLTTHYRYRQSRPGGGVRTDPEPAWPHRHPRRGRHTPGAPGPRTPFGRLRRQAAAGRASRDHLQD
jgi:ABC-2 type transport system ATP-binding protein